MLKLALIDDNEAGLPYERVAAHVRHAQFTAVVDRDMQLARKRAQSLGAEIWTDKFENLLAGHSAIFDGVVLAPGIGCTSDLLHQAAAAKKHLLVDGLAALPARSASRSAVDFRAAGLRLMIGQSGRFSPALRTIKARLDAGRLGEPGLLRIHRWHSRESFDRRHGSANRPEAATPVEVLAPDVDLACWFFGMRPTVVYTTAHRARDAFPDFLQVHFGFDGGGMALVDYARTLPKGDGYFSLTLVGSTGAAYADDHSNVQLLYGGSHPAALRTGEGDTQLLGQLQEFIAAVAENRDPLCTGDDGARAIEVAEAVVLSLAAEKAIHPARSAS